MAAEKGESKKARTPTRTDDELDPKPLEESGRYSLQRNER